MPRLMRLPLFHAPTVEKADMSNLHAIKSMVFQQILIKGIETMPIEKSARIADETAILLMCVIGNMGFLQAISFKA